MAASNVYLDLTKEFNVGRLRAVICSGQAVVLHRLAVMSKDGDWILREDEEALQHVLGVLARHGARYRFGAPLALEWMRGGWSSHFEFLSGDARVRTDFFTRPPRITAKALADLWREQEDRDPPFVNPRDLAELKKTNREKDYIVIGELARLMQDPRDQLLYSRSARDLKELAGRHPELVRELTAQRPLLAHAAGPRKQLMHELDDERYAAMEANELRLKAFLNAAQPWAAAWPQLERKAAGLDLSAAHRLFVGAASSLLPAQVGGTTSG